MSSNVLEEILKRKRKVHSFSFTRIMVLIITKRSNLDSVTLFKKCFYILFLLIFLLFCEFLFSCLSVSQSLIECFNPSLFFRPVVVRSEERLEWEDVGWKRAVGTGATSPPPPPPPPSQPHTSSQHHSLLLTDADQLLRTDISLIH